MAPGRRTCTSPVAAGAHRLIAGQYAPPGHTPVLYAGTEIVEFSPTEELERTFEVVTRNMEAAAS